MTIESAAVPAVSVLMTVFEEQGGHLQASIDSVLAQSFANFEFVIVDDGSRAKETLEVLERAASKDNRIRLIREGHNGLIAALNVGLSHCRGEFVCRQDSDDWSEPGRIERQVEFLRRTPHVAIVGSYVRQCQRNGDELGVFKPPTAPADVRSFCSVQSPFAHGAVCFRKSAIDAIGGYRKQLYCVEDWDCFWRLIDTFGGANIPEVLYNYRFTGRSVSARKWKEQAIGSRVLRILAERRDAGEPENVEQAVADVSEQFERSEAGYFGALREADHKVLAGDGLAGLMAIVRAVGMRPYGALGWLKLVRALTFIAVPPLRRRLFSFR